MRTLLITSLFGILILGACAALKGGVKVNQKLERGIASYNAISVYVSASDPKLMDFRPNLQKVVIKRLGEDSQFGSISAAKAESATDGLLLSMKIKEHQEPGIMNGSIAAFKVDCKLVDAKSKATLSTFEVEGNSRHGNTTVSNGSFGVVISETMEDDVRAMRTVADFLADHLAENK